ncbi:MAG TPA: AbrB/MazE/SpoVT family DNA-binding domain-containing protein [Candidatus Nanoarchaeia archaeon]|nr:AbrB/MazE/SpoVT family DNA-binding domain-containing protein [Candidatus Nanoarchaeia archaeon]
MKANDIELVKMSGKGQLVVPQDIRAAAHLNPGEVFAAFPVEEGVLFKKVEMPKVKLEWRELATEVQSRFKRQGIVKEDLDEAVKWARKG